MKPKLMISSDLALPIETVTATGVVLGMKGMGKTNLGSVIAEELAKHKVRFSIIDPMGVWWGLQYGAKKSLPGIEVLLLGGVHGDIPIEPTAGAVVADLVVDETVSVAIDISRHANGKMWTRGERLRFVRDYAVRLYERQGEKRRPLLQIIDEAARYVPQTISHGDAEASACLSALTAITEEGRNLGIGVLFLTLRSSRINKDVVELADYLVAFRTVGPNSTKAILDWFGDHVAKERWQELLAQLRTLPIGTAMVISPGWLKFEGQARMRMRETFDSSQTPKIGARIKGPAGRARKPDLKKYEALMRETIERAQADNPKVLRAKLVTAEKSIEQLTKRAERAEARPAPAARTETKVEKREVRIFKGKDLERFTSGIKTMEAAAKNILERSVALQSSLNEANAINGAPRQLVAGKLATESVPGTPVDRTVHFAEFGQTRTPAQPASIPAGAISRAASNGDGSIGKGELVTLQAIVQYGSVERKQLSVLTGYTKSSRNTYLSRLMSAGLIQQDEQTKEFSPTAEGVARAGTVDAPPTGAELVQWWLNRLGAGEKAVLECVLSYRGGAVSREKISETTGYTKSSRNTYIHRLQNRKLLEAGAGPVTPAAALL